MSSEYIIRDEDDNPDAHIWEVAELDEYGGISQTGPLVTFNRKTLNPVYSLFGDLEKLTTEQIRILKDEMPYWAEFFKSRLDALVIEKKSRHSSL